MHLGVLLLYVHCIEGVHADWVFSNEVRVGKYKHVGECARSEIDSGYRSVLQNRIVVYGVHMRDQCVLIPGYWHVSTRFNEFLWVAWDY